MPLMMMSAASAMRLIAVIFFVLISATTASRVVMPIDDGNSLRIFTTLSQSSPIIATLSLFSDDTVVTDVARGAAGCEEVASVVGRDNVVILVSNTVCSHIKGLIQILAYPDYTQVLTTSDTGKTTVGDRLRISDTLSVVAYVKAGLLDLFIDRYLAGGKILPGDIEIHSHFMPPRFLIAILTVIAIAVIQYYFPNASVSPVHSRALKELQAIKRIADRPLNPRREYKGSDPVSPGEFRRMMHILTEFMIEYHEHPEVYDVTTTLLPGFLYNKGLPGNAPLNPDSFESIIGDVYRKILPGMTHWHHPRFYAYFVSGISYPDVLAESLISMFGAVQFCWDAAPAFTELELIMVNWVGKALGLPEEFLFRGSDSEQSKGGGAFQNSATDSMLIAILTARRLAMREERAGPLKLLKLDDDELPRTRYIAYASIEAHNSINKAANIALVHIRSIETDSNFSMRADKLEEAIQNDMKRSYKPFFVMATLGTTGICAYDNIREIVIVAKKYGLWVHVDAAYAGSFWVCPELRGPADGLEGVDSVEVNMNKAMLMSSSCSIFWCRHQIDIRRTLRVDAAYLRRQHTNCSDFRDWSISLTRRTRAMKVWFLMRLYGIEGMRQHSRRLVRATDHMTMRLKRDERVEIVGQATLGLVSFRLKMADIEERDTMTNQLGTFINDSHKMFVTTAKPGGHEVIRLSSAFGRGLEAETEEAYKVLSGLIDEFLLKSIKPQVTLRYTFLGVKETKYADKCANSGRSPGSCKCTCSSHSSTLSGPSSFIPESEHAMRELKMPSNTGLCLSNGKMKQSSASASSASSNSSTETGASAQSASALASAASSNVSQKPSDKK